MMKKVAVLLAEGFEEVEAATPIDFLRRAEIEVTVTGVTGEKVAGARNVTLVADQGISEIMKNRDDYDGVIIPGGMPGAENIAASEDAKGFIKTMYDAGKLVAAICAAPAVVLGPLGVLQGKQATCYPGFEEKFTNVTFKPKRVVIDGNIITSRGPGTAAEFSLEIIRYLAGKEAAEKIRSATLQK